MPLTKELKEILTAHKIELSDVGYDNPPIDVLIGSDFYGRIIANGVKDLKNGLVAINTKLGWTVVGEKKNSIPSHTIVSLCMSVHDKELPHLWDLESLGIRDPVEVLKGKELDEKIQNNFIKTVKRKEDGRYVVSLPWKEDHPPLPSNKDVAFKRLESTTKKLVESKLYDAYDKLFQDWMREGFIEKVDNETGGTNIHYLPHRAVVKNSLTTPVRPVFDASCKKGKSPSLNQCLYKGCNLILNIPEILLRFRENEVGFTSDVRKAFQMIEVEECDRDCFRFLWWKDSTMTDVEIFRHVRVPFGATCSPFILGAVLKLHLTNVAVDEKNIAEKLLNNFYVDNCVCSVSTIEEYHEFKGKSVQMLSTAQMELRMWLSNKDESFATETKIISILGLLWNRELDTLSVESSKLAMPPKLTKRTVLSLLQKIFDPVGFTCPVTLPMKLLLQRTWLNKVTWDSELPENEKNLFIKWSSELNCLSEVNVPRFLPITKRDVSNWSVHVFTDASKDAYATAVFLRSELSGQVKVQLMGAKSRVAPPKKISIPRLELLASLIGATLYSNILKALELVDVPVHFWCDSTTVLAWIKRNDQWGTFVGNRVKKILNLSRAEEWRYVPSALNAADLPSRGCSPKELLESQWWEGPAWLKLNENEWPVCDTVNNEQEITAEMQAVKEIVLITHDDCQRVDRSFRSWIKITGWMNRFIQNYLSKKESRVSGPLSERELEKAEISLVKAIQKESINEDQLRKANIFDVIRDQNGVLRVKTRITQRDDMQAFKYPAILPGKHPIVKRMIFDLHRESAHAGVGIILSKLREKYWLIQGRRTVKKILNTCYRCRRFSAKATRTETAVLPFNRVKDAEPFEVSGVDLAGPLFLRNGKKVWMVIFTCAVYRAVHLRIIESLSTKAFVKCLNDFITRFRRPAVIYSDNGTNFHGANNLFSSLDWNQITKDTGLERIEWIFNPSTASWWGGFWERLIRSAKDLIRRTLGKSKLNKKELEAVLWTVEQSLNNRPLTYVSEDPQDLDPLTPNLFLHPFGTIEFPEKEMTEAEKFRFRMKYIQTLRRELKDRWRNEYLGLLVARNQKPTRKLQVGELVVVSTENRKRVEWPLARIIELIPSKGDGVCRVAKIKTENGVWTRPVQRLHPLEADLEEKGDKIMKQLMTKSGRVVKVPARYE